MTYNVFGGTLSLTQSINQSINQSITLTVDVSSLPLNSVNASYSEQCKVGSLLPHIVFFVAKRQMTSVNGEIHIMGAKVPGNELVQERCAKINLRAC